jgi:hypothetical protein
LARSGLMGGTLSCNRHSLAQICSGTKSARAPINCPACRAAAAAAAAAPPVRQTR